MASFRDMSFKDVTGSVLNKANDKATETARTYVASKAQPLIDTANNIAGRANNLARKADNDIIKNVNYGNEGRSVPTERVSSYYGNEGRSVPFEKVHVPAPADSGTPEVDDTKFGYKVRLFAARNFPSGERVVFEVSPTLSESRAVEYNQVAPVHMPGSIQIYKRTGARTFSLNAKLVSRNVSQATQNIKDLQQLRGWCMPYFGVADIGVSPVTDSTSMLGAPPDVLYLFAYSAGTGKDTRTGDPVNLKKIPVVITNLSFSYPDAVDYITTTTGEPFPVIMEVTVELLETHSPYQYETFSLADFKVGKLAHF